VGVSYLDVDEMISGHRTGRGYAKPQCPLCGFEIVEMHMRVDVTRQEPFTLQIDHFSSGGHTFEALLNTGDPSVRDRHCDILQRLA